MIRQNDGKKGVTFGVRVHAGGGKWRWIGTYKTREAAEEAERLGRRPRKRKCPKCNRVFRPTDDRRVRCPVCIKKYRAEVPPVDDHWLYRCYGPSDELLYVGITSAGIKRFRRHGNDRAWWPKVSTIRLEHFDTRAEVEVAEAEAIAKLRPLHNRQKSSAMHRFRFAGFCSPVSQEEGSG